MIGEEKERYKKRWEACSPEVRKIIKALEAGGFLQIPKRKKGWGLSSWMLVFAAEEADKAIKEEVD